MPTITVDTDEYEKLQLKAGFVDFLYSDSKGEKQFTDGKIQVEGKVFHVHKSLLCSRSNYFNKLYTVEMKEKYEDTVKLEMSKERTERILEYCYTVDVDISNQNVLDLFEDADFFQINHLKKLCVSFILQNIDAENCLKLLSFAQRYNLEKVVDKSKQVIGESLDVISQQDDFNQLSYDYVHAIVQQENTKKKGKIVFKAIIKWVKSNPTDRKDLFGNLFLQIDLSSLSGSFLKTKVAKEELVRLNHQCCSAIMDFFITISVHDQNDGSEFLVVGGVGSEKQCVLFDVANKTSELLPNLTTERNAPTSVAFGDKVFVFGGYVENYENSHKSCEMFELQSRSNWIPIADMPEPKCFAASAVLNDLIYVAGGYNAGGRLSSCFCYDPNRDVWSKLTDMSVKRSGHAMVSLNGSLYCIGGHDGNFSCLNSCEQFNNGRWMKIPSMNKVRNGLAAVVLNGCIYAIGGWSGGEGLNSVECYDPRWNKWFNVKPMNVARYDYGACVLQENIYAVGGYYIDSIEVYDPSKDEWTILPDMKVKSNQSSVVAI